MKYVIIIALFVALIAVIILAMKPNIGQQTSITSKKQKIEQNALALYQKKKNENVKLDNGPCLGTIDGYAVDVAHSPRQPIDDLLVNQCSDFMNGKVSHFIELTPGGSIIRIK